MDGPQIRYGWILNENNPLSSSGGDDESEFDEFYGEDPDAPHPHSNDDDGVVVAPVEVSHSMEITDFVFSQVNVNRPSSQAGLDIYREVLTLVVQKLNEFPWFVGCGLSTDAAYTWTFTVDWK